MSDRESIAADAKAENRYRKFRWLRDRADIEADMLTDLLAGDRNEELVEEILDNRGDWLNETIHDRVKADDEVVLSCLLYMAKRYGGSWLPDLAERIAEKETTC